MTRPSSDAWRGCAGNDLKELYAPATSREAYNRFMLTQNLFLARLYGTRLATVASIRSAAALTCHCTIHKAQHANVLSGLHIQLFAFQQRDSPDATLWAM